MLSHFFHGTSGERSKGKHSSNARRRRRPGRRTSRAPTVEPLEPRQMLSIGIGMVTADDTGVSNTDNITSLLSPRFILTYAPPAGTTPSSPATLSVDGVVAGSFPTVTSGQSAATALTMTAGKHVLTASATVVVATIGGTPVLQAITSAPLTVVIDNTAPAAPSAPVLLSSSDSGTAGDKITNVTAPAFQGTGEAAAFVRILARKSSTADPFAIIGQGVVGPDGNWEVTVEPLRDNAYDIVAVAYDVAGNFSSQSTALTALTIDATAPQRPTIDLLDAFDTGRSNQDNTTLLTTLNFRVSADPGTTVNVKDGNTIIDTFTMPVAAFTTRTIDFTTLSGLGIAAEGPHPLSTESSDAAGNRAQQSHELLVTIDSTPPAAPTVPPDLLDSSDSGTFNNDNVTNVAAPAFQGAGEANAIVRILARKTGSTNPFVVIGQGVVGSDLTNPPAQLPASTPAVGSWEVTVEPLTDGSYDVIAQFEDQAGNLNPPLPITEVSPDAVLDLTIDTIAPNTPYLDLTDASDTGRHNTDNVTNDNTPTVTTTADDVFAAGLNLAPHDIRYRIFDRAGTGAETLLVDSFATLPGLSTANFFTDTLSTLADGVHNLKVEVEDRAGNISHAFLLEVTIDTVKPPVLFGFSASLTDGLDPPSDSGVQSYPATFTDRVTNVTAPTFFGTAEANSIVRLYVDTDFDPSTAGDDVFIGKTVTVPLDGNQAPTDPDGQWNLKTAIDLNDPLLFPHDGTRQIIVTAEDLAGNVSDLPPAESETPSQQVLDIFIDTQGPQITDVHITGVPTATYNLFGLKPGNASQGPTPLVFSLTIDVRDLPNRDTVNFSTTDPVALQQQVAETLGNYVLSGDANGTIAIQSVTVTNNPLVNGAPATATIALAFAAPLPDDRYTLTISDTLVDPAGNRLDGESNAQEPNGAPHFPSGDGQPGGSFVARFTVDSRPELGVWSAGSVYVDTNGNFTFDPQNPDAVNRDIVYKFGYTSDDIFAGNFTANPGDLADGFDKLAAYGRVNSQFRWLIDTNNDGVPDLNTTQIGADGLPGPGIIDPAGINGLPVAGNFDGNAANGDEVGVFDGTTWYLDGNHDYQVANNLADLKITGPLRGYGIVGDFDGDGAFDLATWQNGVFQFDLAAVPAPGGTPYGAVDFTINTGFIGPRVRPVAADMDRDGYADVGLWVPDRSGVPGTAGEWYFLISAGQPLQARADVPFTPVPLGNDLFAQFGDQFAIPVVGNFDPPVAAAAKTVAATVPVASPAPAIPAKAPLSTPLAAAAANASALAVASAPPAPAKTVTKTLPITALLKKPAVCKSPVTPVTSVPKKLALPTTRKKEPAKTTMVSKSSLPKIQQRMGGLNPRAVDQAISPLLPAARGSSLAKKTAK